jgi:hypothetical protein
LGVAAYRFAQFFFPIFLGAVAYASLRFGPWKIEKRDRLARLRDLASSGSTSQESTIDFAMRFGRRLTGLQLGEPLDDEQRARFAAGDLLDDDLSDHDSPDDETKNGGHIVESAD